MIDLRFHPYPGVVLAANHIAKRTSLTDGHKTLQAWQQSAVTAYHLSDIECACKEALYASNEGKFDFDETARVQLAYAAGFYHVLRVVKQTEAGKPMEAGARIAQMLDVVAKHVDARANKDNTELNDLMADLGS